MFGLSDFIMYNLFHCLFSFFLSLARSLFYIFSTVFMYRTHFYSRIHQKTYTNVAISLFCCCCRRRRRLFISYMCMYVRLSFWLLLCIFYSFYIPYILTLFFSCFVGDFFFSSRLHLLFSLYFECALTTEKR